MSLSYVSWKSMIQITESVNHDWVSGCWGEKSWAWQFTCFNSWPLIIIIIKFICYHDKRVANHCYGKRERATKKRLRWNESGDWCSCRQLPNIIRWYSMIIQQLISNDIDLNYTWIIIDWLSYGWLHKGWNGKFSIEITMIYDLIVVKSKWNCSTVNHTTSQIKLNWNQRKVAGFIYKWYTNWYSPRVTLIIWIIESSDMTFNECIRKWWLIDHFLGFKVIW